MRVSTSVGELYVEESGTGPAVVLWHSFLHHGGMWSAQIEALAPRFRVISIDAPGHGRSGVLRRSITMEECARAVVAVMDARGVDRAAMVGLSWGGMVAMELAATRADRLRAIALLDTSCRSEPLYNRVKYGALAAIERRLGPIPPLLDAIEPLFFCERTRRERRDLIEPWRAYVLRLDPESIVHALAVITRRRDMTERLRRIDMPALVVAGVHDRAQPVRESERIAAALPGARLSIVPDAGHLSAVENPTAVNALLLSFLS